MTLWHQLSPSEALSRLDSSATGLSPDEASRRLLEHGPNLLPEGERRSRMRMLAAQFADFMIIALLVAAGVAGAIGDGIDAAVILAIVVLNAVVGFIQESRAEKALTALRKLAAPQAAVLRDGREFSIPATELVPGDVVRLESGMLVPADLRLLEAARLTLEEALLTGEAQPAHKQTEPLATAQLPIGDRDNCCYRGTTVSGGRGLGVVVATGSTTELGRIAALLLQGKTPPTPLQRRLAIFGRRLSLVILAICTGVFLLGLLRGEEPLLLLLTAVSLAVAAIPEALPAVVTVALALGAAKLVRKNALVRKLHAVETLGAVTYICSDKTGTLTENRMTVAVAKPADSEASTAQRLIRAMALCNDATANGGDEVRGEATEIALYRHAAAAGLIREAVEGELPRLAELPFDAGRKRMTTLHAEGSGVLALIKGAPEVLLPRCVALPDGRSCDHGEWAAVAVTMADDGLRVLAFAERRWPQLPAVLDSATVEEELTLLGLVGLIDPPRAEAAPAIAAARAAGIIPVMITGDHPHTARAIARQLDLLRDGDGVLSGTELAGLDDASLDEQVATVRVYARVAPEQKLRIVQALQRRGELVAMTGDGVNDAPALQSADIGLAMGRGGTDVAREAAHMVLLDDNFATIVGAIREGRRIYANILKFIVYSLTGNAATLFALTCAPFFGLPLPLLPTQILWLNLLCDSLPGLALVNEKADADLMTLPPRPPQEGIFAGGRGWFIAIVGLLTGLLALALQAVSLALQLPWQSLLLTFFLGSRLAIALAVRAPRQSSFSLGITSNRPLLGAIILTLLLQLVILYLPAAQRIFTTAPLTAAELAATLAISSLVFWVVEGVKWWRRRHSA